MPDFKDIQKQIEESGTEEFLKAMNTTDENKITLKTNGKEAIRCVPDKGKDGEDEWTFVTSKDCGTGGKSGSITLLDGDSGVYDSTGELSWEEDNRVDPIVKEVKKLSLWSKVQIFTYAMMIVSYAIQSYTVWYNTKQLKEEITSRIELVDEHITELRDIVDKTKDPLKRFK